MIPHTPIIGKEDSKSNSPQLNSSLKKDTSKRLSDQEALIIEELEQKISLLAKLSNEEEMNKVNYTSDDDLFSGTGYLRHPGSLLCFPGSPSILHP